MAGMLPRLVSQAVRPLGKTVRQNFVLAIAAIATLPPNGSGSAYQIHTHHARYLSQAAGPEGEDEVSKAHEVAATSANASAMPPQPTIFSRILAKEIPADIVHEDEKVSLVSSPEAISSITLLSHP